MVKNYFNRFRKKGVKAKAKKVAPKRGGGMTFQQKVQKIIASNVENKYTDTKQATLAVLNISGGTEYKYMTWSPGSPSVQLFDISQGVAINQRIGNGIKIKKWIIKGMIQPNTLIDGTQGVGSRVLINNTQVGYVDIYFGKYLSNLGIIEPTLINFYQNGNVDITPTSLNQELLYRVNKDLYKVYYHKRFKMGGASQKSPLGNDNFNLTRSFGFDITKYILKNKQLKYDEIATLPMNVDIHNLTIWAIWHPAVGDAEFVPTPTGVISQQSFYVVNLMSYAEYEDA